MTTFPPSLSESLTLLAAFLTLFSITVFSLGSPSLTGSLTTRLVNCLAAKHSICRRLHDDTLVPARGLARVLALLDLGNHEVERLGHVLVVPRTGFCPRALEFVGERAAVFGLDLALFGLEVGFVAYDDEGDRFDALCSPHVLAGGRGSGWNVDWATYKVVQDLVADDPRHLEALLRGHRVDDQVAMDADEVLRVKNAVLILRRSEIVSRAVLFVLSTHAQGSRKK